MKTILNQDGRSVGAGVVYKVDPQKLSIKLCHTAKMAEDGFARCTNYENFALDAVRMKSEIPEKIGRLPAFVDGVFYCETEQEAQDFIRKQIGM